ncbi:MAG: hypothetical protein NVS3B7_11880 [Candidatus Elarobacter sp.]
MWILAVLVVVLLFGCVIRATNLERKGYTNDEATTSLHVSGHTIADYDRAVVDGRVRSNAELRRFQFVDPATTFADVASGLAREDPQHPPLYYVLERVWLLVFGDSIAAKRSMSAAFGSLVMAGMVWLGSELFRRRAAGFVAAALVAVSPFHVVYAQQAREYALWTLLTVLASALLLRALRCPSMGVWIAYGVATVLGLYTDPLYVTVVAAHAVYVVFLERTPRRGTLLPFFVAIGVAFLAYGPWLAVLLAGAHAGKVTNNTYLAASLPLALFALKWMFNVGTVFYDLDYRWPYTAVVLVPIFTGIALAFIVLVRRTERRIWLFAIALTGVPIAALLVPDLVHHETRSTSSRYLVPAWLGIELAVAWLIARVAESPIRRQRKTALACFGGLLAIGAVASTVGSFTTSWWADGSVPNLRSMANVIAAADRPSIVYHSTWGAGRGEPPLWDFIIPQLIGELPGTVLVQQIPIDAPIAIDGSASTVFLVDPTDRFRGRLAALGAVLRKVDLAGSDRPRSLRGLRARAEASRGAHYTENQQTLWRFERLPQIERTARPVDDRITPHSATVPAFARERP